MGSLVAFSFAATMLLGDYTKLASPDPRTLAVSDAQRTRARELVDRLASPAFDERERAAKGLRSMGRLALPALGDALGQSADAEARAQINRLLPAAEAADFATRALTLLADRHGKYGHDLPGWNVLKAAVGDSKRSRSLFTAILWRDESRDLLIAMGRSPGAIGTAITAKWEWWDKRARAVAPLPKHRLRSDMEPTLPDLAAILLAEIAATESNLPRPKQGMTSLTYWLSSRKVRGELADGPHGSVFRKLFARWLDAWETADSISAAAGTARSLGFQSELVTKYLVKATEAKGATSWHRSQAMSSIAGYGLRQYLPTVIQGMSDQAVIPSPVTPTAANERWTIQVRDKALAAALFLTDQSLRDYGFTVVPIGRTERPGLKYHEVAFRFETDARGTAEQKRAAAFAQWREWECGTWGSVGGTAAVIAARYTVVGVRASR